MKSTKFKIDETKGTYTVLTPVTEKDILTMANQLAKNRLAKGNVIECIRIIYNKNWSFNLLKKL